MKRSAALLSKSAVPLLLAISSSPAFAGGVRIVEPTGTQNFSTIQAAIDAAPAGAVLLVGEGSYPRFVVNGKPLSIFAVPGAAVDVESIVVGVIPANEVLVLSGLTSKAPLGWVPLYLTASPGMIRVQDCRFVAQDRQDVAPCGNQPWPGTTGAQVYNCAKVAFTNCSFTGGKAGGSVCEQAIWGGRALEESGSSSDSLVLYDCDLQGGGGGDREATEPGIGGEGARFYGIRVLASNTRFRGGGGGAVLPNGSSCDGPGGVGCSLYDHAAIDEIGSTFVGACGAAGLSGGSAHSLAGVARTATISTAVQSDASLWSISYQGAPGDRPLFLTASSAQVAISLPFHGAWLLRRNTRLSTANFGLVDPSGAWSGTAPAADLPAGTLLQLRTAQVAVRATAGVYLGSAKDVVLLDRDSGPDCDGNGVSDFVDVIEGTSPDLNHNLIPDSCPGG